jgi:hypothetical protein
MTKEKSEPRIWQQCALRKCEAERPWIASLSAQEARNPSVKLNEMTCTEEADTRARAREREKVSGSYVTAQDDICGGSQSPHYDVT